MRIKTILAAALLALGASGAQGAVIGLFDGCLNVDGDISASDNAISGDCGPGAVGTFGGLDASGLGMVQVNLNTAGAHSVDLFVDHEIDEAINTFFNETGSVAGAPAAGQSWEIDEPGFVFGDIFDNFELSAFDNTNAFGPADDVSMGLGWDFVLADGESAVIKFFVSDSRIPNDGSLYLSHIDPDSDAAIYFWSTLDIRRPNGVPEPGSLALLSLGLLGMGALRRRRQQ